MTSPYYTLLPYWDPNEIYPIPIVVNCDNRVGYTYQ